MIRRSISTTRLRHAAAAVELALLVPFLVFLLVLAIDFGRVFYHLVTVTNCARNGALYGSMDAQHRDDSAGIDRFARMEGSNLNQADLKVTATPCTDSAGGSAIDVEVACPFRTITGYIIPAEITLRRQVRMRVGPTLPHFE